MRDGSGNKTKNTTELIKDTLDKITKKHGFVSPELLLIEATKKSHPLHDHFDWNNDEAARKWRLNQAAQIIRASRMIVFIQEAKKRVPIPIGAVREYLVLPGEKSEYWPRAQALSNKEIRNHFIEMKLSVLRSWLLETTDVDEFKNLRSVILKGLGRFSFFQTQETSGIKQSLKRPAGTDQSIS